MEGKNQLQQCNIQLALGLGQAEFVSNAPTSKPKERKEQFRFQLSFSPYMKEEADSELQNSDRSSSRTTEMEVENSNTITSVYSNTKRKTGTTKKLVLTNEQVVRLEENFREHSILTPSKKHELATQLNLQPRQVEVWFQNRRARTKLKQREMDCEFWKTYCERLRDENQRLKIELQDLRSRKLGSPPVYVHLPLTMTPSCEKYERRKESNRAQKEETGAL